MSGIIHSWPIEIDFNRAQIRSRIRETDVLDFKSEASYIVFKDGGKIYAKNGDSGMIEYSDADISSLLQNVINTLYSRYGGGKIFIKRGIYYPTKTVYIPDGIKLIIEGEGNNTVFRWTTEFTPINDFLCHIPSSPSWTSEIILRNFKVDRSGSGNNKGSIGMWYAKLVVFQNIEFIDDWRDTAGESGLGGYNNLIVIAEGNRVFNKNYGISLGGYLVVLRDNYVRNTAGEGIIAAGINRNLPIPSDEPPYIINVIENNLCVDCGRTDEAVCVDIGTDNPTQNGLGIIRNNVIVSKDYQVTGAVGGIRISDLIVENNLIIGNIKNVIGLYAPNGGMAVFRNNRIYTTSQTFLGAWTAIDTLVFEDNIVNITLTSNSRAFDVGVVNKVVVRNNKMNINYNVNAGVDAVLWLGNNDGMYVEGNEISVSFPSGYGANVLVVGDPPLFARGNRFTLASGSIKYVFQIGAGSDRMNIYIVTDNIINNITKLFLYYVHTTSTLYSIIRNNIFLNASPTLGTYIASGASAAHYIDADPDIIISSASGLTIYRLRRNSGVATIPAGSTRITVSHGLASTPAKLQITPLGQPAGKLWVENITSTSFDIVTDTAPTADLKVSWQAEV